jgi:hypothetical protein
MSPEEYIAQQPEELHGALHKLANVIRYNTGQQREDRHDS